MGYGYMKQADTRTTLSEWPVKIWAEFEFPDYARDAVLSWMKADFSEYLFVKAPKRGTTKNSYNYMFGYREDELYYHREDHDPITVKREQITQIGVKRELLNAVIIMQYRQDGEDSSLEFPYVPSTYYLYDPLLNWMLDLPRDFEPLQAERLHPRPMKLYKESLPMFNYSLAAYRLGAGFDSYTYRFELHRHKFLPWKRKLEERMEVSMDRGTFRLHSFDYLTEYVYILTK